MKHVTTKRGFFVVEHPEYLSGEGTRLVGESSAIGEYEDSMDRPGSSYLWVGKDHHLDREEITGLVAYLQGWLKSGRL